MSQSKIIKPKPQYDFIASTTDINRFTLDGINKLLGEYTSINIAFIDAYSIKEILQNCRFLLVRDFNDNKVIAFGFLFITHEPIGKCGSIKYVVIDDEYGSLGIKENIIRLLILEAKRQSLVRIDSAVTLPASLKARTTDYEWIRIPLSSAAC